MYKPRRPRFPLRNGRVAAPRHIPHQAKALRQQDHQISNVNFPPMLPRGANCILCDVDHTMMSWALVITCPCFTALVYADAESISGVSGRGYRHRTDRHAHSAIASLRHRRGYLRYRCRSQRQRGRLRRRRSRRAGFRPSRFAPALKSPARAADGRLIDVLRKLRARAYLLRLTAPSW